MTRKLHINYILITNVNISIVVPNNFLFFLRFYFGFKRIETKITKRLHLSFNISIGRRCT